VVFRWKAKNIVYDLAISRLIQLISLFFLVSLSPFVSHAEHGKTGQYIVGFAQDTLANDWRAAQVSQLEAAFKKYPNVKFIYTDARGQTARQIQDIEDLLLQKVDVLITSPRDAAVMTPVISQAYKMGIPVVLITRKILTDDYTVLVSPDDEDIARQAAAYMAKKMNYRGNILILKGIPTATTAIARTKGFLKEIGKYKNIKIVSTINGNYLRADTIREMDDIIGQGIKFDAIYAQSDSMASGARLVLDKAGYDTKKMIIVGVDYIKEARDAIRRGEQTASFVYPTSAAEAAKLTLDIIEGKKVPRYVKVESQMVTRENVDKITPIF